MRYLCLTRESTNSMVISVRNIDFSKKKGNQLNTLQITELEEKYKSRSAPLPGNKGTDDGKSPTTPLVTVPSKTELIIQTQKGDADGDAGDDESDNDGQTETIKPIKTKKQHTLDTPVSNNDNPVKLKDQLSVSVDIKFSDENENTKTQSTGM